MRDKLLIGGLRLVPKSVWSRCIGAAAHFRLPKFMTQPSIRIFARAYDIDVSEADRPLNEYRTVGEFFARRLRQGARPVDRRPGLAVAPADGVVLNSGRISDGRLVQVKGRSFEVADLLNDPERAKCYAHGSWLTVYLSPKDYHRVHHPVEGTILSASYIGGHLWPVNAAAVQHVDELFCVNERIATFVASPLGEVATVMVGATSVGHITLNYDDTLETNRRCPVGERHYATPVRVPRGAELGTFHLGSTAIVLFSNPEVRLEPLVDGEPIRMGEIIARL
ncbi:MAG: archaetidylserine decarboxylase [Myxococcota bacterium]|nr:archaetidylserine decarboxylase [Myxococcota bacterium]